LSRTDATTNIEGEPRDQAGAEGVAVLERADGSPLLSLVLGHTTQAAADAVTGAVIGTLVGMNQARGALIEYSGQPSPGLAGARSAVELRESDVGKEVVLIFERGDPRAPIIIGVLDRGKEHSALDRSPVDVDADGERVVVTASKQVVLRCGQASITLTREGKVLIRGTYLSSHSSGVNRIKGGSVEIN
jgi:hypothetical protein